MAEIQNSSLVETLETKLVAYYYVGLLESEPHIILVYGESIVFIMYVCLRRVDKILG